MAGLFGMAKGMYDTAKAVKGMAPTTDETASHRKSNAPYSAVRREAAPVAPAQVPAFTGRARKMQMDDAIERQSNGQP